MREKSTVERIEEEEERQSKKFTGDVSEETVGKRNVRETQCQVRQFENGIHSALLKSKENEPVSKIN